MELPVNTVSSFA
jgi:hypothetical protein